MRDKGRDIPLGTQFLLVETKDGSHLESDYNDDSNHIVYTVFFPLIEGSFRACLQGNNRDKLELCIESSNSDTKESSFSHVLFINANTDLEVTQEGVDDGIQSLVVGGPSPKFPLSRKVGLTIGGNGGVGEGDGKIHEKNKRVEIWETGIEIRVRKRGRGKRILECVLLYFSILAASV
ncbi:hypothetical protein AHAS_Ahas07G0093100 [Arachis hypogaea]